VKKREGMFMRFKRILMFALCAFFFVGCTTLKNEKSDEKMVRERSQARLNALLAQNIAAAWEYNSPAYKKSSNLKAFQMRVAGSGSWEDAKVDSVECEEERCKVQSIVTYYLPVMKLRNTRPIDEVWIKVDGQWWIYQK
jgi:hypothetical protein